MNRIEIPTVARVSSQIKGSSTAHASRPFDEAASSLADRVEISSEGEGLSRIHPPLRLARIESFREQISSGTFENTARLEGTIDALLALIA